MKNTWSLLGVTRLEETAVGVLDKNKQCQCKQNFNSKIKFLLIDQ